MEDKDIIEDTAGLLRQENGKVAERGSGIDSGKILLKMENVSEYNCWGEGSRKGKEDIYSELLRKKKRASEDIKTLLLKKNRNTSSIVNGRKKKQATCRFQIW